jgi:hypothetical protein
MYRWVVEMFVCPSNRRAFSIPVLQADFGSALVSGQGTYRTKSFGRPANSRKLDFADDLRDAHAATTQGTDENQVGPGVSGTRSFAVQVGEDGGELAAGEYFGGVYADGGAEVHVVLQEMAFPEWVSYLGWERKRRDTDAVLGTGQIDAHDLIALLLAAPTGWSSLPSRSAEACYAT